MTAPTASDQADQRPSLGPGDIARLPSGEYLAIIKIVATPVHASWYAIHDGPATLLIDSHTRTITVIRVGKSPITFQSSDWSKADRVYEARDYNIQVIGVVITPAMLGTALAAYSITVAESQTAGTVEVNTSALYHLIRDFEQTLCGIAALGGNLGDRVVEHASGHHDGKMRGLWYSEARRMARRLLPASLDPVPNLPRPE